MKEIKLGKHKLKIYDSIDELPVIRHHKFNKMVLIDAHIGADLSDFDAHVERIVKYITTQKGDLAIKELTNLRQNIFLVQSQITPKHLAFAALVHTLDGEEITDLSDESLSSVCEKLSDVSFGELAEAIENSKKKLESELQTYFPYLFESASVKEYYDALKKRTVLLLDQLIKGELSPEEAVELDRITTSIILFSPPHSFSGSDSLEIQQDRQFENACLVISQVTHADAKKFTVLEYYNALGYLREQMKNPEKNKK